MRSLLDSHAHIHGAEFEPDRADVIARAHGEGVETIVTVGTDVESSAAAIALAEQYPSIWATVGIHPHEVTSATALDWERLVALAASPMVVAVGEIGLDYHYDHSPRTEQIRAFEDQLETADQLNLPIVVHSRDADEDTYAVLSSWAKRRTRLGFAQPNGVMHCYAYGPARLNAFVQLGMFISISGIVTYTRADQVQEAAILVGEDALLLETDCPYLAPQSRRGRRNEPALLPETAARVAALRGTTIDAIAGQSTTNARRLFRLPVHEQALRLGS